jgi:hypothetical protein
MIEALTYTVIPIAYEVYKNLDELICDQWDPELNDR